jgi:xylan 1,4-beta-xylosidase
VYFRKIAEDRSLWSMYNQAAEAMKKVDPTIKTGGYAPCWPSVPMIKDFYTHCHQNVDFISWHKYLTGSSKTPDEYIMRRTSTFGQDAVQIREMINQVTPGKDVQLALTEYNINWNWKPHDPRQATQTGAAWLASVLLHLIEAEVDISNNWHSRGGGTFGLFGPANEIRPAAKVLYLYNKLVKGRFVESKYSSVLLECLGFIDHDKSLGLILVNKKDSTQTLELELLNVPKDFDLEDNIFEGNTLSYSLVEGKVKKQFVNLADGNNKISLEPYEMKVLIVQKGK